MKYRSDGTLVARRTGSVELADDLGIMVINEPDVDLATMKRHDTDPMDTNRPKYRPLFLEHFEKKEVNHLGLAPANGAPEHPPPAPLLDRTIHVSNDMPRSIVEINNPMAINAVKP
ncbi:hypothetical protein evm_014268 [Chilo suppressalis]|nr:hypothetical protein evm_014268 [Chilo suppressalis]